MPKGAICEDHVLIVPIVHEASTLALREATWREMERFKTALRRYFASQDKELVVLDRNVATEGATHCHGRLWVFLRRRPRPQATCSRPRERNTTSSFTILNIQGCHFRFVGPSLDARPLVSRSTSSYAALNPLARLASVISNAKSPQLATPDISTPEVVGDVQPSEGSGPLPYTSGSGEPGSLANEVGSKGASKVHAEHVLVTRLVQAFVRKGFK
ncbi:hypothetical protein PsorP6_018229 [Peronosclerospora sorghi]|uniref:Uncharacterized protein n=1 Tax=Peronosclerospora sorghi TaxID=230839 RepID=A0ACC0WFR5_9STRA|nr:hypothetical protein PsorP6_018229 [Peronosclerospora sorghi]